MAGKERRTRCDECKQFFHKATSSEWVKVEFVSAVGIEIKLDCSAKCAAETTKKIPSYRKAVLESWKRDRANFRRERSTVFS